MKRMSTSLLIVAPVAAALVLTTGPALHAQGLGELAKAEAARRAAVKNPTQPIKNEDLKPVPPPAVQAQAPAAPESRPVVEQEPAQEKGTATGEESAADAGEPVKPREKRDEPYWRGRFSDTRGAVNRANEDIAAVQARIAAIDADLQNAKLPPARQDQLNAERERARGALARFQQQAKDLAGELANLEQRAKELNVNPDWTK